jgi:hypothetical protein
MDSGTLVRFSCRKQEGMTLLAAEDEEVALDTACGLGRVNGIHAVRMHL